MVIKSEHIFTKEGIFKKGQLCIKDGLIDNIKYCDKSEDISEGTVKYFLDASDMYVLPGLVDIHLHGANGYDICDGNVRALKAIEEYELKSGITTIFPATMTLPEEELLKIFKVVGEYRSQSKGAIAKITMEGPFLSSKKKGAQNQLFIKKPDINLYRELQTACGLAIGQVVIAPEEDDEFKFISEVSRECVVSVGHTTVNYELSCKAFEKGANHVTHLFNGMNGFSHREPGILGAAYDNKDVYVELICDGIHVHPSVIRMAFALLGSDRICLISDSMRATGKGDGEYTLGGQNVYVRDGKATLSDGTIAGSICNLYDCMKKAVQTMGIPLETVITSCTKTPAKSMKMDDVCGVLEEGRCADILILDKDLSVRYVIKKGQILVSK